MTGGALHAGSVLVHEALQSRAHHLRYHVAGPLEDHVVAGADVLAVDVVLVVQRGALHRDAADKGRSEHRERREHAGATHVDLDAVQPGDHRGGRELEGDRPARIVGHAAQRRLEGEGVDLHDSAVDVVVELAATRLPAPARRGELIDGVNDLDLRVHGKAAIAQPGESTVMVRQLESFAAADGVTPQPQRPGGRHSRVQLTDGPGRRVTRIDEGGQAFGGPPLVQPRKGGQRQVHLAAHLHDGRRRHATQPQRQRLDGAQVGGHVLAHLAVAARGAHAEDAVTVDERDGEAVDLGLHHVAHRLAGQLGALEEPAVARVPGEQLVLAAGIGQREHRLQMAHLRELLEGRRADAERRRVGRAQLRTLGLDRLQLAQQRVILGVVYLRLVEDVVLVGVVGERGAQLGGADRRIAHGRAPAPGSAEDDAATGSSSRAATPTPRRQRSSSSRGSVSQ